MNKLPILLFRLGHFFFKKRLNFLAKAISLVNRLLFAVWLPSSATIGKGFVLGYGGLGIVIHSNTKIGDRVTIAQNVTIGRNFGDKMVPVIGDDVYIGTGSVVFGEIFIGNNVIIGANSLVNKSIPDNCTFAGNPGKIIKTGRTLKYYELDNQNSGE